MSRKPPAVPRGRESAWLRWAWGLVVGAVACRSHPANACSSLSLVAQGDDRILRWDAHAGYRYQVESAEHPGGPWSNRAEITTPGTAGEWTDAGVGNTSQRFYRLLQVNPPTCAGTNSVVEAVQPALIAADGVPRDVPGATIEVESWSVFP